MSLNDLTPEIAWAAGLFEGEGCIRVHAQRHYNVTLLLSSSDRDVIEHFASVMGAGKVVARRQTGQKPHWKQMYFWSVSGKTARGCLLKMLPALGERRGAKAREAIAAVDTIYAPRTCEICGRSFAPITWGQRRRVCGDDCRAEATRRWKRAWRAKRRALGLRYV